MLSLTHCHPRHPAQQCFWYIPAGLSLTMRHPRIGSSAGNGGGTKWAVAEMKGHRTGTEDVAIDRPPSLVYSLARSVLLAIPPRYERPHAGHPH